MMNNEQKKDWLFIIKIACLFSIFIDILLIFILAARNTDSDILAFMIFFALSIAYSCISYIIIPIIIFQIAKSKLKYANNSSEYIDNLLAIMIIYFISYLSFFIYYITLKRDAISDAGILLIAPWVTNIIILVIFFFYYLFVNYFKIKRKR